MEKCIFYENKFHSYTEVFRIPLVLSLRVGVDCKYNMQPIFFIFQHKKELFKHKKSIVKK